MSHIAGDPLVTFTIVECEAELADIRAQQKALRGVPDGRVGRTAIQLKDARAALERDYRTWLGRLRGARRQAGLPAPSASRFLG